MNNGPFQFDFSGPGEQRPIARKRQRFVARTLRDDAEYFPVDEETFFDPGRGVESLTTAALYLLDCGHVAGAIGPAELVGSCGARKCTASLCFRCSGVRCGGSGCNVLLCPKHRFVIDGQTFCPRCRVKERLRRGAKLLHFALRYGG